MKKKSTLLLPFIFISTFAFSQKQYFQQDVAYDIRVTLDDAKDELHAFETLTYKNNSPDALPFIYMHLWPNAYRDNSTPLGQQLKQDGDLFFYYSTDKDKGYIDSLDFKVDGQPVKLDYVPGSPDIGKITLNAPLQPGEQITITTPFHVKIPSGKISRLGHIGQQYQVTQWYPKPAVYDKDGWEEIPFLNQGEFYSEFGTFDVYITLPKNYVLKATGDVVDNPDEMKFMDDLAQKTKDITKYDDKDDVFPASSPELKTVHYHQEHVHDFAWFCDKRYHVLKGEVTLPHSRKKVTTWVLYTNQYAKYWKDAITYMDSSLYYYSLWNGDYLYDVCTAVDGALSAGGGMEYPNITVIGAANSPFELDIVITHEVGHNWFYGMLGSNERKHAWMDEGINSANELRYAQTRYPNGTLLGGLGNISLLGSAFDLDRYKHKAEYYQGYIFCARQRIDQPDELPAADFQTINYGTIVYMKSAVIFDYLRGYLGDSLYDKCFQAYFDEWHFKHPMPEDIRAVFEKVSGKDLSWLFVDLIQTTKVLDYKICSSSKDPNGNYVVIVKNTGDIVGPVALSAIGDDGKVLQTVWYDGFTGKLGLTFPKQSQHVREFKIDYMEMMPEVNRKNNTIRTSGICKKVEPLKLQFLGSLDNPDRTQLFFSPTLGWNNYDKFMLGAVFYNHVVPGKKFEWDVMPMYSFGSNALVGHTDVFYHIRPSKIFQEITIGGTANMYHYNAVPAADTSLMTAANGKLGFLKVAPELNFDFRKKVARSPVKQSVKLRAIWLQVDEVHDNFVAADNLLVDYPSVAKMQRTFYEASYLLNNTRHINPFSFTVKVQQGDSMMKLQFAGIYNLTYKRGKNITFRLFAGTFLNDKNAGPYRFQSSGWGPLGLYNHDYLFDHIFLGRSEQSGLLAQQMVVEDGGMKVYTANGQSDSWLTALNVTIPSPMKGLLGHISIFGDVAMNGMKNSNTLYDAGLQVSVFRNGIMDIYFPLLVSPDIKKEYDANGWKYNRMIRFTFNIDLLNPFRLLNNIQI